MPTQLLSHADLDWYKVEDAATDRQIHALIRRSTRCERFLEAIDWLLMTRTGFRSACDLLAALDDHYHELLLHSNAVYQRLYTFPGNDQSDDSSS